LVKAFGAPTNWPQWTFIGGGTTSGPATTMTMQALTNCIATNQAAWNLAASNASIVFSNQCWLSLSNLQYLCQCLNTNSQVDANPNYSFINSWANCQTAFMYVNMQLCQVMCLLTNLSALQIQQYKQSIGYTGP
jgi:hypothetical protein